MQNVEPLPDDPTFRPCAICENKGTTKICNARGKCLWKKTREFSASFNSFDRVFDKLIEFADPKRSKAARKGARTRNRNKKARKKQTRIADREATVEKKSKASYRRKLTARKNPDPDTKRMLDKAKASAHKQMLKDDKAALEKGRVAKARGKREAMGRKYGDSVTVRPGAPTAAEIDAVETNPSKVKEEISKETRRKARGSRKKIAKQEAKLMTENTMNPRHPRVTGREASGKPTKQTRRSIPKPDKDVIQGEGHTRANPSRPTKKPPVPKHKKIAALDAGERKRMTKAWARSPRTVETETKSAWSAIRKMTVGGVMARMRGRWHG